MSQDQVFLENVGSLAGRLESMLSAFLESHPQLADSLASFGTRNDMLSIVMVGLGFSFLVLLAALMMMRPKRVLSVSQPTANRQLLFSKYAYQVPGEQSED